MRAPELAVRDDGTIQPKSRKSLATSLDGVFAAGDIVRGASLVVWAVRDGQDAAAEIHDFLQARASAPRLLVGAA
jgi:glutamate synthase (NADPH/NADH) small chain